MTTADPYASARDTTEGRVYTVTGGDWDTLLDDTQHDERVVINMGPSTRPRTACCGSSSSWRARPSPRPGR